MASEWPTVTVGDIASRDNGAIAIGPFGSRMKSDCYVDNGIPVIRGMNISQTKEFIGEFVYISAEKASTLGSANVYPGDLVFPHRGAIGQVAVVPNNDVGHYVLSSSLMKLTVDREIAIPEFVFYYFRSAKGNHEILQYASTVGTPGIGQPLTSLRSMELPRPPLPEQKAIAHVLGALDDRIELNRRMNETLEGMAQALFKSWFVDFDPVIDNAMASGKEVPEELGERAAARAALGDKRKPLPADIRALFPDEFILTDELGWIPNGWEVGCVGNEFDLTMGQSPPGTTYNEVGEGMPFFQGRADFGFRYPTNRVYCTAPKRFAQKGDTLVSVRAPVGDVNMAHIDCCIGRGVSAVRHNSGCRSFTYYSMLQLREHFYSFEAEGTVFGSINQKDFKGLTHLKPRRKLVEAFEEQAGAFDSKIALNTLAIINLSTLRDTLLPKLLSGELRIPDAEKLAVEAGL